MTKHRQNERVEERVAVLARGDRLPDVRTRLRDGSTFHLSDDAGGLPVVLSVGPALTVDVAAVVLHVPIDGVAHGRVPAGVTLLDDGSIAAALTGGAPGVVVAGPDHRVLGVGAPSDAAELVRLLEPARPGVVRTTAIPISIVPDVLDPGLCRRLVDHAAAQGLTPSPMLRPDGTGAAALQVDETAKARLDHVVRDQALHREIEAAVARRLLPEIVRGFALRPTSYEPFKVVRYDAGHGWFHAHRDNTTADVAHRRLAITVGLDDDYAGGEVGFPELGADRFRPPTGAALVFSCGLLHELTPVTAGSRHALVTFVW